MRDCYTVTFNADADGDRSSWPRVFVPRYLANFDQRLFQSARRAISSPRATGHRDMLIPLELEPLICGQETVTTYSPTEKDRKTVETMSAYGVPMEDIARSIGISIPTIRKYFEHELHNRRTQANAAVAQSLFQKATGPGKEGVVAAIFWLKCRAGWNDRPGELLPPLGKKELAQEMAKETPGGDWGDDLNVVPFRPA
jgi:hypothetical protein